MGLSEETRKVVRDYKNEWHRRDKDKVRLWREQNPEKVKAAQERFWEKMAQETSIA